jgi:PGF-pre-PGF domain-containing protein
LSWPEDTVNNSLNLSQYFADVDGDDLNYTSTVPANVVVSINNDTGIVSLTPAGNWSGVDYVVFTAYDPIGLSVVSNNISLNVTPVNDAPVFSGVISGKSWDEDSSTTIDLSGFFSDIDNASLLYYMINNSRIVASFSGGVATLTPVSGWFGVEVVRFVAGDGEFNVSSNNVTLTVVEVVTPVPPSGGGGGGGGAGGEKNIDLEFNYSLSSIIYRVDVQVPSKYGKLFIDVSKLPSLPVGPPLKSDESVYANLSVKFGDRSNLSDSEVKKLVLFFAVEKSWLKDYVVDSVTLRRYHNSVWENIPANVVGEDSGYYYFSAKPAGLSYFAITAEKLKVKEVVVAANVSANVTVPEVPPVVEVPSKNVTGIPTTVLGEFGLVELLSLIAALVILFVFNVLLAKKWLSEREERLKRKDKMLRQKEGEKLEEIRLKARKSAERKQRLLRLLHAIGLYRTAEEKAALRRAVIEKERKELSEQRRKHEESLMYRREMDRKRKLEQRHNMIVEIKKQEEEERKVREEEAARGFEKHKLELESLRAEKDQRRKELELLRKKQEEEKARELKRRKHGEELFRNRLEIFKEKQKLLKDKKKREEDVRQKKKEKRAKFRSGVRSALHSFGLYKSEREKEDLRRKKVYNNIKSEALANMKKK